MLKTKQSQRSQELEQGAQTPPVFCVCLLALILLVPWFYSRNAAKHAFCEGNTALGSQRLDCVCLALGHKENFSFFTID